MDLKFPDYARCKFKISSRLQFSSFDLQIVEDWAGDLPCGGSAMRGAHLLVLRGPETKQHSKRLQSGATSRQLHISTFFLLEVLVAKSAQRLEWFASVAIYTTRLRPANAKRNTGSIARRNFHKFSVLRQYTARLRH